MELTSSSKGNAATGQRDSGHLAVPSMQCGAGHRAGTSDLAAPVLLRRDRFLSLHIRSKHRVHTGKVSLPLCLEPIDDIAVEAKVNGSFPAGHNDAGTLPKARTERLGFGCIRAGLILAAFPHDSDLAKGVSHDGRFLFHLCSLSGR